MDDILGCLINFFDFGEVGKFLFEVGGDGGVHVSDEEDAIVEEDVLCFFDSYFFDLKGILVNFS